MKRVIYCLACLALVASLSTCVPPVSDTSQRDCDSAEHYQQAILDPNVAAYDLEIEGHVQNYLDAKEQDDKNLRGERIVIPVVVHILHNGTTDASNITDAQVNSQITALNESFRATNSDINTVPAAFADLVADPRIEFALARRDPDCNATTGITRQMAGNAFYTSTLEDAKQATAGGVDPWDPEEYLNIWVVDDLRRAGGSPILGYSSFPADPLQVQGFVCEHRYFGTTGTGTTDADFALGRTAVHEFGHFFNRRHIWGDDDNGNGTCTSPGECAGSDLVADTPNAGERNYNQPAFPLTDCCTTMNPGVLFMNYMDYVDDPAMVMFTQGQVDRMVASLYTTKAALLASDALFPPPAGDEADLLMLDTPSDLGNEPNNESEVFYKSEDIWIRNGSDGETNQEHQNPVGGTSENVYVRVRNKGCATSDGGTLKLYWAKASAGLSWEDPWTGGVSIGGVVMGGLIGEQMITPLAGGETDIYVFAWNVPDPNDYAALGGDKSHFCLLARIEETGGMTSAETTDLGANVKNNNNIVWKNVTVSSGSGGGREAYTAAANFSDGSMSVRIAFEDLKNEVSAFSGYDLFVELNKELFDRWDAAGRMGDGIEVTNENIIHLLHAGAYIEGFELAQEEIFFVRVYTMPLETWRRNQVYLLNVVQYDGGSKVGGQIMVF